jgi:hypothetical protein
MRNLVCSQKNLIILKMLIFLIIIIITIKVKIVMSFHLSYRDGQSATVPDPYRPLFTVNHRYRYW